MSTKDKLKSNGNTIAGVGGLFTILSLTIIEEPNWKIIVAGIGVVLAVYGVYLISKSKKAN